jgi:flagellar motor protein MotB
MKKSIIVTLGLAVLFVMGCKTNYVNPNVGPEVTAQIPELFSPNPDVPNDKLVVPVSVKHVVPLKEWSVTVQPNRQRQNAAGQNTQRAEGGQRAEGQRPAGEGGQQQRRRGPFFEQSAAAVKGKMPKTWDWDGKGTSGEMVQSATDYLFTLTVSDIFDNSSTFEGIINVDVLVRREGENLRIIVPSIVFPPNSANFALLSPEEMRPNTRVLRLIANALNKFADYQITVEGHSNPTTPPDTAQRTTEETRELVPLSGDRAKAVIDYLVNNNNVGQARLKSVGIGGERTVADWDDSDENWKNRRVEFILHK